MVVKGEMVTFLANVPWVHFKESSRLTDGLNAGCDKVVGGQNEAGRAGVVDDSADWNRIKEATNRLVHCRDIFANDKLEVCAIFGCRHHLAISG